MPPTHPIQGLVITTETALVSCMQDIDSTDLFSSYTATTIEEDTMGYWAVASDHADFSGSRHCPSAAVGCVKSVSCGK